jgi:hypothetical protein
MFGMMMNVLDSVYIKSRITMGRRKTSPWYLSTVTPKPAFFPKPMLMLIATQPEARIRVPERNADPGVTTLTDRHEGRRRKTCDQEQPGTPSPSLVSSFLDQYVRDSL